MKLYATVASERATKGQGGNDYIRIDLQRERGRLSHIIDYSEVGLRVTAVTDDGGVILYEERKGEKQKGENYKMIGFPERENIILGYTSDVDAFIKESINNGWKRENIKAIKQ